MLDLKIAAEIELAGLTAKKRVMDEMVSATRNRKDLEAAHVERGTKKRNLSQQISGQKSEIKRLDNTLIKFGPLPLLDNKVVIQPIQWAEAP